MTAPETVAMLTFTLDLRAPSRHDNTLRRYCFENGGSGDPKRQEEAFNAMWPGNSLNALLQRIDALSEDPNKSAELITLCSDAFRHVTKASHPEQWALVHQYRGTALVRMGEVTGNPDSMSEAIDAFDATLSVFDRASRPFDWAGTLQNRANALVRLGEFAGDPAILRQAVADFEKVLGIFTRQANAGYWAMAQFNRANALFRIGELTGDAAVLRASIACSDDALSIFTRIAAPQYWAMVLSGRANAALRIGTLAGDPEILRASAADYCQTLEIRTRHAAPEQWAMSTMNRAIALQTLGDLLSDQAALAEALDGYGAVMGVYTRQASPARWAMLQQNRAVTLTSLAELTGKAGQLRDAVVACDAALEVRVRATNPSEWAMTQQNRANALLKLGELTSDLTSLREAVIGCNLALEVRTIADSPMDWAIVRLNRAQADMHIAGLLGDPEHYRAAVTDCDAALTIFSKDRSSTHWAMAHHSRANALQGLADLSRDADGLALAVAGYEPALTVFARDMAPVQWAMIRQDRANTLMKLGSLMSDEQPLNAAIADYEAALEASPRDASPAFWAMVQQNRAVALAELGRIAHNADLLRAAITGHEAALETRERNNNPGLWATTSHDLALSFLHLHRLTGDAAALERAIAAWDGALSVWTMEQAPDLYMAAASGLAQLLIAAGRIEDARARIDPALGEGLRHLLGLQNRAARERAIEQAAGLAELRSWIAVAVDRDGDQAIMWIERGRAQLLSLTLAADPERAFARDQAALEELLSAIPDGGAAVVPIITSAGARVAVIPSGRTSVDASDFIDLPDLTREEMGLWLFGPVDLPEQGGYVGAYENARFGWTRGAGDDGVIAATLGQVWHKLLGPIDLRLQALALSAGAPIVITPPGLLTLLPLWSAMPVFGEAPFGARWTVSLSPSLTALRAARSRAASWEAKGAPVRALAVLDPASQGNARLPGAKLEGSALLAKIGADRCRMLAGPDATAQAVLGALEGRTHLHLATHGSYAPFMPKQSAILLAGEQRLTLGALQEIDAVEDLRLVVLSACDSGLPGLDARSVDEFISLPTGFVQAGAAAVIASHWPVRDDAAFFLTDRFYQIYLDEQGRARQSPAEALQSASLWLRDVTCGDLAASFEVARDGMGVPIEGTIDRSKACSPIHPRSLGQAMTTHFTPAEIDAIRANPAAYILPIPPDGTDPAAFQPFAHPAFWAAFSITGI